MIQLVSVEAQVQSPAQSNGLRIWHGHSCNVACSSWWDSIPDLGNSTCCWLAKKGSITEEEYFDGIEQLRKIPAQVEKVLECNDLVGEIAEEIKEAKDITLSDFT